MKIRTAVTVGATAALATVGVGYLSAAGTASAAVFYRLATPHYAVQGYMGKCIDVPGAISADGAQLQLWDCNRTPAQSWEPGTHGSLMALGKCMDVAWGSTANGAKVQLAWCNGGPAQTWVINSAGDLLNPQANKCVDVRNWNPHNGAALQLWDCFGESNQKWHFHYLG